LDSVGFNRHFNKLPEDPQGNLAVREGFEPSVPHAHHNILIIMDIYSSS